MFNINENTSTLTKAAFKFTDFYFWLVHHYSTSLNDYPYATANGFNFWTIMDGQTVSDKEPYWFGLSAYRGYILWGIVSVLAVVLLAVKKRSAMALYYADTFLHREYSYLLPKCMKDIYCLQLFLQWLRFYGINE
jgi:hypothetical protein